MPRPKRFLRPKRATNLVSKPKTDLPRPVAQRKCAACGRKTHKSDLLRVCVSQNEIRCDPSGKSGGRGAYVCKSVACIDKACAKRAFGRTLKTQLSASDTLKSQLHGALE